MIYFNYSKAKERGAMYHIATFSFYKEETRDFIAERLNKLYGNCKKENYSLSVWDFKCDEYAVTTDLEDDEIKDLCNILYSLGFNNKNDVATEDFVNNENTRTNTYTLDWDDEEDRAIPKIRTM